MQSYCNILAFRQSRAYQFPKIKNPLKLVLLQVTTNFIVELNRSKYSLTADILLVLYRRDQKVVKPVQAKEVICLLIEKYFFLTSYTNAELFLVLLIWINFSLILIQRPVQLSTALRFYYFKTVVSIYYGVMHKRHSLQSHISRKLNNLRFINQILIFKSRCVCFLLNTFRLFVVGQS